MPSTEVPPQQVQEEQRGPSHPSPGLTSMAEKLSKLMTPFTEAGPETNEKPSDTDQRPKVEDRPVSDVKPGEKDSSSKPADVAAVPKEQPDEELPESIRKSPKASEEFKKVRTLAQQARTESEKYSSQVKTLEGEIAKLKSIPAAIPPEFETLKKEHAALSDQLKAVAIERHPSFRTHFENRTATALEKAKANIGADLTDKAAKLAQLPPSDYRTEQLDKMIMELQETSPTKALFLSDLIKDVNGIAYDREAALKKSSADYEAVQKHEAEQAKAAQVEQEKKLEAFLAQVWTTSKEFEAFKRGDDAKANELVDAREKLLKSWLGGETIEKLAPHRVPGLAIEALFLRDELLPTLREENAKLTKQIAAMTRSTPKPGETTSGHVTIKQKPGSSFVEIYKVNAPVAR